MVDTPLLDAVVLEPAGKPRASVVWLHGLGADGHDFEPIVGELGLSDADAVRFVFPHAPHMPVTVNNGYVMRAWYDIAGPDIAAVEDEPGIRSSAARVVQLVERELAGGVTPERVILAGFSQGGAIALHTGLRYPQRLGGILALSTYLPLAASLAAEAQPANRDLPVMVAHGTADPIVPLALAERTRSVLEGHGCDVDWHTYPMQHGVIMEEVQDIGTWLRKVLGR